MGSPPSLMHMGPGDTTFRMKHCTSRPWRALLPVALTLALTGCGGSPDLSEADVDRIARRTAEIMREETPAPVMDPAQLKQAVAQAVRTELAKGGGAKPTPVIPPPAMPPPVPPGGTSAAPPAASPPPAAPPPATKTPPAKPPTGGTLTVTDRTQEPRDDLVLAKVGSEEIRLSDFDRMVGQNERLAKAPPIEVLNNLVHFRLMAQAAEAAGFPEKDPKVLAQVKDRLDSFRMELLIRSRVEAMPAIDEARIQQTYNDNTDTFTRPARIQLHEIVVATQAEAEELAKKVTKENFSKLAGEHSIRPTARRGGNLGEVTKERFKKERWAALVEAEEGAILGPFEAEAAQWQLLLRGPFQERKVEPIEKVRDSIQKRLEEDQRQRAAATLLDEAGKIWPSKILQEDPAAAEEPDAVLFEVGSSRFTKKDFQAALAQVPPQQTFQVRSPEGKKQLLSQLFQRELLSNLAKTNSDFLEKHSTYLDDVRRQLVINAFAAERVYAKVEVSEDDVRRRYASEKEERFKTPPARSLKARHILIRVDGDADDAAAQPAKEKILAALARVKGGEDFAAVAREVSEGPTKPKGGDLGQFGPGRMVKEFDTTVQALKDWEVTSEPVRTQFGFHIIRKEPTPQYLSFTEVRAGLTNQMKSERQNEDIQGLLASLKAKTDVQIFSENLPRAKPTPKAPPPQTLTVGKGGKVAPAGGDPQSLRFEVRDGKIVPVKE